MVEVIHGDCIEAMSAVEAGTFDAVVTDPDYGIRSGRTRHQEKPPAHHMEEPTWLQPWERDYRASAYQQLSFAWGGAAYRLAKPGAWLASFGTPRTCHRLSAGLEDAGWQIRDMICWNHNQGNPTAHVQVAGGAPTLRPVWEVIVLATKKREGSYKNNWEKHGTGLLWKDRVRSENGTWPTNLVRHPRSGRHEVPDGNDVHTTVKPLALMRWLVRLVVPKGGVLLDPFAGTGTTGEAALLEGSDACLIEQMDDYIPIIKARLERAR